MKTLASFIKLKLVFFLVLALQGCGAAEDKSASSSGSFIRGAVKDSSNNVVAYLVDLPEDDVVVLMLSTSPYYLITLNPFDGTYTDHNVYFTQTDCGGVGYADDIGDRTLIKNQSVILSGSTYYLVNGAPTTITSQSEKNSTGCGNHGGGGSLSQSRVQSVEEISRPYDFTTLAPLTFTLG